MTRPDPTAAEREAPGLRILLLAARNVTGQRNGRITVLETAVKALTAQGHTVTVLALTSEAGPDRWLDCPVRRIAPPKPVTLAANAVRAIFRGSSLNESIFDATPIRNEVRTAISADSAQVVVADGIRIWPLVQGLDVPVIMHLDDLLSDRYRDPKFIAGNESVLGYFSSQLPRPFLPAAERLVKLLLGFEARRLVVRERQVAQAADFTALTSRAEAEILAARSGKPVSGIPMAVDPREPADPAGAASNSAVFLGALYYGPNMAALRFVRDELLPLLRARGVALQLDVIGAANPTQQAEFADCPEISIRGYVDDLTAALHGHRMFLSPVTVGTGVKTKVLDGMSVGLPVVATRLGVAGIPMVEGQHALVADSAAGLAEHIELLVQQPETAAALGAAGRALLAETMSVPVVQEAWRDALDAVRPEFQEVPK